MNLPIGVAVAPSSRAATLHVDPAGQHFQAARQASRASCTTLSSYRSMPPALWRPTAAVVLLTTAVQTEARMTEFGAETGATIARIHGARGECIWDTGTWNGAASGAIEGERLFAFDPPSAAGTATLRAFDLPGVAVLISGRGSNLQALLEATQDAYEIALVVSNVPGAGGLERAGTGLLARLGAAREGAQRCQAAVSPQPASSKGVSKARAASAMRGRLSTRRPTTLSPPTAWPPRPTCRPRARTPTWSASAGWAWCSRMPTAAATAWARRPCNWAWRRCARATR